ncbi:trehalose-6-phosphate hydrolase [Exophiala viscosa]|uniref:trehalose-6-phosphate hydrolase n=1 Tax=Exophiala viscosa TaxID=2486360 RepID=UPI0021988553|nr:trehalose-6-phosphate hydrolase [Exophiala viscosa]
MTRRQHTRLSRPVPQPGSNTSTTSNASQVTALRRPIQRAWWKESIVYQIYPASFKSARSTVDKTDGTIKGDIRGIIQQLDYLSHLGVDIIWLSPILQSPQVDMGYDISDYRAIDPLYGTMEDHDALVAGLHDRGMKYVMDLVVNHTSDQHAWFQASRSSKTNPYRDWYFWRPPRYCLKTGERLPPNNWESLFGGSAWAFDEITGEYYLHLFATEQPDLNWDNPAVRKAVHDLIRFWLDKGVDGFRMDVINLISKEPGLPDGKIVRPGFLQSGLQHYACGPRLHEYLRGIGSILREYDAFSVGEMPGVYDTKEVLKAVGQDRGELAMAFQFDIVRLDVATDKPSKWYHRDFDPKDLRHVVAKWNSFMLQNGGWHAPFMENHDQGRSISRYCDDSDKYRSKSAKLLAAHMGLQFGTVFVYQGQELAQINVPESWGLEEYKDIEVVNHWKEVLEEFPDDKEMQEKFKKQYRLIGRDCARTPMQWTPDEKTYAGFLAHNAPESVKPWMSVHPDHKVWNAEAQVADENSAFHYWRRILRLRKEYKDIFVYGGFEMLDMKHPFVVAYVRKDDSPATEQVAAKKKCLVLANFSAKDIWWTVPVQAADILIDESAGLKSGAVVQELRNYIEDGDGAIEAKRQSEGLWSIKLRPWEVIVAMT